ncbi:MAG: TetR family transcriptional regulator [Anaerolineales bacterium]
MPEPGIKRGRMHDAEGARAAILDAAEKVFAEHGFDGARIDAIATQAHYNKSLIFQYFGDKLALYDEVIRRADDQTRVMQNEALGSLSKAEAALDSEHIRTLLGEYVGWYFDYLLEHPTILRIYMWEMAEGWQTFSKIVSQRDFDDVDQFAPVLEKLESAGLLRSNPNLFLQLSSALFFPALFLSLLPMVKMYLPTFDPSSPAELAQAREFVIEFVLEGLLVTPAPAES